MTSGNLLIILDILVTHSEFLFEKKYDVFDDVVIGQDYGQKGSYKKLVYNFLQFSPLLFTHAGKLNFDNGHFDVTTGF